MHFVQHQTHSSHHLTTQRSAHQNPDRQTPLYYRRGSPVATTCLLPPSAPDIQTLRHACRMWMPQHKTHDSPPTELPNKIHRVLLLCQSLQYTDASDAATAKAETQLVPFTVAHTAVRSNRTPTASADGQLLPATRLAARQGWVAPGWSPAAGCRSRSPCRYHHRHSSLQTVAAGEIYSTLQPHSTAQHNAGWSAHTRRSTHDARQQDICMLKVNMQLLLLPACPAHARCCL